MTSAGKKDSSTAGAGPFDAQHTAAPAAHTPGPWRADEYGVRSSAGYICKITWPSRYPGQIERYAQEVAERTADARLIAAAPSTAEAASKMLGALEKCHRLIERDYSDQRAAALEGHPIARDAREEWDATCNAIAAAKAAGIKSPLPEPQSGEHP